MDLHGQWALASQPHFSEIFWDLALSLRSQAQWLAHSLQKLPVAYVGELFGTSVLGGLLAYPVARFLVGAPAAAITVYILPFFVSCAGGTVLAIVIVTALKKAKVFDNFLGFSKEVRA